MSHARTIFMTSIVFTLGAMGFTRRSQAEADARVRATSDLRPPSFQFCFEVPHGRCFNTGAPGKLVQLGGNSPSEARVSNQTLRSFDAEISKFMRATSAAVPRKPRQCQQALAYRSFNPQTKQMKIEAVRCLEFLKKSDFTSLSKLVTKLSKATKP